MPDGSATAHLYRPKLLTLVGENYGKESFRSDVAAALTVAIVALPLSMAIAVASGVRPALSLFWYLRRSIGLGSSGCCSRFCYQACF